MMRNINFALFVIGLIVMSSCQSNEEFISEKNCNINLSFTENTVWHNTSRAETSIKDIYYILDENNLCQAAVKVNHSSTAASDKFFSLGNYNVFCITDVDPSGLTYSTAMIGTNISSTPMVLNTLTDVCFGQQSFSIVASKTNYDISVTVHHTLAKLALSIANVPSDIASIKLTLGNVSKTFTLNGTFTNDDTTQDLNLQKAATANDDGTYDWTLPESLIYPCYAGATSTDLIIVATSTSGKEHTYDTSSTTVCSSGTRTSLTSTWRTLTDQLSYGYTETPWTETVQQGSFDM